jgi:peptidoglycan/LPS O-acetylase OafA/YrhL
VNNPKARLPFLDGIRGVAILAVFLYHSLGIVFGTDKLKWNGLFRDFDTSRSFLALYPLTYGWAGVAVFFVVSGFCIHLSHQQSRDKGWFNFCNRRFFRIYPPYLLAIFTFFFLWPWGSFSIYSFSRLEQLGTHVLAVHNFGQRTSFGINPAFWSIAVEIQLYAIYPLLLFIVGKRGWGNGLMVVAASEMLIRFAESISSSFLNEPLPFFVSLSPFAYWFSWSIGAYLAQCFLEGRSTRFSTVRFDLVAVAAFALPLFKPTAAFAFLAFALLTGIAIDRLISERWAIPKHKVFYIAWEHLSFLGVISYSFYLFHQPIIGLTNGVLKRVSPHMYFHPFAKLVICCAWYPLILIFSYCIFRMIEQPSIAFGRVVWEKSRNSTKTTQTMKALIDVH